MENTFRVIEEWRDAHRKSTGGSSGIKARDSSTQKWHPPESGGLKLNVDASFFPGQESFSVGMVIRNQEGMFVGGKCICLPRPATVMEAECIGIREALSWIMEMPGSKVMIETDSLMAARAMNGKAVYLLEVGHVIDHCRMMLSDLPYVSLRHVRKQANRVAHSLARVPCLLNCSLVFTSPPTHLVEIILNELK